MAPLLQEKGIDHDAGHERGARKKQQRSTGAAHDSQKNPERQRLPLRADGRRRIRLARANRDLRPLRLKRMHIVHVGIEPGGVATQF